LVNLTYLLTTKYICSLRDFDMLEMLPFSRRAISFFEVGEEEPSAILLSAPKPTTDSM
jgi:hypothetical protein